MFVGYEDAEAIKMYEDELYHEESSSDGIDSEVEFHLYSQIHYSQNLEEIGTMEMGEEAEASGFSGVTGHSSVLTEKQHANKNITEPVPCIQISDDSEIIVLSDTSDEDSVYKSKAMKSRSFVAQGEIHMHPRSSTPYHAKAAGCNTLYPAGSGIDISRQMKSTSEKHNPVSSAGAHAIQEVLVIDDSSEEESLASESDNVESWMLLGAGADDRDENILLNLEDCASPISEACTLAAPSCASRKRKLIFQGEDCGQHRGDHQPGEDNVDWSICNKDLEAQISNYRSVRHTTVRYYTAAKNVTCRNCSRPGHLSKNCLAPKKIPACCLCAERGHLQNSCPARFCLNCSLPGHYFKECVERPYWNKHCSRCDMKGHYADACPEIWRQYHLTTEPGPIKAASSHSERPAVVYCYNCSRKGHFGYECSERRMHGSMFPSSPFIRYYDDEHDIKRRANRLKRKVAELYEAGLLPEKPETPWQDEEHERHSQKKKNKPWKEHQKHNKDGKCHESLKMSQAEKHREEKHRSDVKISHSLEEDFPRGCKRQACEGDKIHHKSNFKAFSDSKTAYTQESLQGARRKKKWKKRKDASADNTEDLFRIKQKKKRKKKTSSSW